MPKPLKETTVPVMLRLPASLVAELNAIAARIGLPRNVLIENKLRAAVGMPSLDTPAEEPKSPNKKGR